MSTTASMSSTSLDEGNSSEQLRHNGALEYRALHTGAVAGLVLGIASVFTLAIATSGIEACLMVCPIPLIAMFLCLRAWLQIRQHSDQYTGRPLAIAGFVLATFFLVTGVGYGSYVYATEVPEGYTRITFGKMKPNEIEERGRKLIPDDIAALQGQKVFIKGYIRPDSLAIRKNAKNFLLVRDNNQCCFGDFSKVKYYDQIQVDLQGSLTVDYSTGIFRIGGTLQLHPENLLRGPGTPVFSLVADHAK
ncbi:MAG: DUF4190 domain-containing protein [Pirellulales bacterium]|nr:DUF4190 domain-containing protein [Pirellulales bacterium]